LGRQRGAGKEPNRYNPDGSEIQKPYPWIQREKVVRIARLVFAYPEGET